MQLDRRPYRAREILTKICRICGQSFETTRRDAQYDKPACRKAASRMRPEVEELVNTVNRAKAVAERTLFDLLDDEQPLGQVEQALRALDAVWPELRPWIRAMLSRLAHKRRPTIPTL